MGSSTKWATSSRSSPRAGSRTQATAAGFRRRRYRLDGIPSRPPGERSTPRTSLQPWAERIHYQIEPYLDFAGDFERSHAATVVNNLDWTQSLAAIDFLRGVGNTFGWSYACQRCGEREDCTPNRGSASPRSATRSCRRADYLGLYRRFGCTLQTGGSDQGATSPPVPAWCTGSSNAACMCCPHR